MASVHLARTIGTGGFGRTVAIKRLHPHLASDPEFVEMFLDEARLASRIHHPNVVSTLDVVNDDGELLLVMDYVLGESWWHILRAATEGERAISLDIVSAVIGGMLNGLHAAHEARSESGEPLEIVHRDVSPQNVLVGADGMVRVVDFGVAKAISRLHSTREGELKGKLRYMSPEQLRREKVDRRADIYAAAVVLWESLTGSRLFMSDDTAGTVAAVLLSDVPRPSSLRPEIPPALDDLVMRAIANVPDVRPQTALEFTAALEAAVPPAPTRAVADFVGSVVGDRLDARRKLVAEVESTPSGRLEIPPHSQAAPMTPADRRALAAADTAVSIVAVPPARSDEPTEIGAPPALARPKTGKRRIVTGLLLAMATAGGAGLYVWGARSPAPARLAAPTEGAGSTSAANPSASAISIAAETPPVPAVTLAVRSTSTGSATRSSSSAPQPPVHRVPSHRPPAPSAARPTAAPSDDCNPSFTLDANGVKRFKPGCL